MKGPSTEQISDPGSNAARNTGVARYHYIVSAYAVGVQDAFNLQEWGALIALADGTNWDFPELIPDSIVYQMERADDWFFVERMIDKRKLRSKLLRLSFPEQFALVELIEQFRD